MDIDRIISRETARKRIYGLLSRAYCLPDEQLPALTGNLVEDVSRVEGSDASYHSMLHALADPGDPRELAVDFTRLFVGPYSPPAPPYGSVYLEGERKVMGDSTVDAASRYRRFGIQTAGSFRDAPDHVAAELEFMFFLIHREVECLLAEDFTGAGNIICEQHRFLNDHLNAWAPEFTDLVIRNARMPFYRNLAGITRMFIDRDADYLSRVRVLESNFSH